jgi:hypothetical protein
MQNAEKNISSLWGIYTLVNPFDDVVAFHPAFNREPQPLNMPFEI